MDLLQVMDKEAVKTRRVLDQKVAIITDVNRLIALDGAQDMQILRDLGMHHSIVEQDAFVGNHMILVNANKTFGGQVFTRAEIKKMACRFALKFLRTDNYKGGFDVELTAKLKAFAKEHEVTLDANTLGRKFYILAPAKAFNLQSRPIDPRPERAPDPIMFYECGDGLFKIVHKWGNDFTAMRRIIGFKYQSETTYTLFWFLMVFVPLALIVALFTTIPWAFLGVAIISLAIATSRVTDEQDRFIPWSGHKQSDTYYRETWCNTLDVKL